MFFDNPMLFDRAAQELLAYLREEHGEDDHQHQAALGSLHGRGFA